MSSDNFPVSKISPVYGTPVARISLDTLTKILGPLQAHTNDNNEIVLSVPTNDAQAPRLAEIIYKPLLTNNLSPDQLETITAITDRTVARAILTGIIASSTSLA